MKGWFTWKTAHAIRRAGNKSIRKTRRNGRIRNWRSKRLETDKSMERVDNDMYG